MVQSINTKVDLVVQGTAFTGMTDYGKIMIGDQGFEFYSDRDVNNFVQIPWEEVEYVIASILFKGKWIPRFSLRTKKNGDFIFATKDPKKTLRAIREYIDPNRMVQSLGFSDVVKNGLQAIFGKKNSR